jgi:Siphovirus ReqiPepy6 Gp37-like protein
MITTKSGSIYKLLLEDEYGQPIDALDKVSSLNYALRSLSITKATFEIPLKYQDLIRPDRRIKIYRQPRGGENKIEGGTTWIIRKRRKHWPKMTVTAVHPNHLLRRRIVAYYAGSPQADKGPMTAESMMKEIMLENFGASAGAGRDLSKFLSIEADIQRGATLSKAFSRRNVLTVLEEISQTSTGAGVYLTADTVTDLGTNQWIFRTFDGQRGQDRRLGFSNSPVLLNAELRNLTEAELEEDWENERNYAYVGGDGTGAGRIIVERPDLARIAMSDLNRCEMFVDASNSADTDRLEAEGDAALREARPRRTFAGRLAETRQFRYGINYYWGDHVTGTFDKKNIECRLDAVSINVGAGREDIDVRFGATD